MKSLEIICHHRDCYDRQKEIAKNSTFNDKRKSSMLDVIFLFYINKLNLSL